MGYQSTLVGRQVWEYKVVELSNGHEGGRKALNDLGKEGWELVSTISHRSLSTDVVAFYFKRPVE